MVMEIDATHRKILDSLFTEIPTKSVKNILDVGSGRTSALYLTEKFPNATINGIVYPGDKRKTDSIKKFVTSNDYDLQEVNLGKMSILKSYDVVLAHLFLGEAEKFNNKSKVLFDKLISIKTRFLVIVDWEEDKTIDYEYIFSKIKPSKIEHFQNKEGTKYIGILVRV